MLTVALNRPREEATTVRYALGVDADPATPDADVADHDGMDGEVTIATGATEASIGIAIRDDTDIEAPRESFTVTLQATEAQLQDFGLGIAAVRVTIQEGVCDRTRQVRNALSRSLPCEAVSETDLASRTELDLANRALGALQVDDLSGLSRLTVLDLSGNVLTSLPDGMFAGLWALVEVQLHDNPGAPFTLQLQLERTDGALSSRGPASVVARVREGAPFAMRAALSAVNGTLSPRTALVPAGRTAGTRMAVVQDAAGATRVTAAAPAIPATRCGVLGTYPCFQGIATGAGRTLVLFKAPPEVTDMPSRTTLAAEGDAVRIDLSALLAASDGGALTYFAGSSDPTLATATVDGDMLTLVPNEDGREGAVTITVSATDDDGLSVTLTFEVVVESIPRGLLRGWRPGTAGAGHGTEGRRGRVTARRSGSASGGVSAVVREDGCVPATVSRSPRSHGTLGARAGRARLALMSGWTVRGPLSRCASGGRTDARMTLACRACTTKCLYMEDI